MFIHATTVYVVSIFSFIYLGFCFYNICTYGIVATVQPTSLCTVATRTELLAEVLWFQQATLECDYVCLMLVFLWGCCGFIFYLLCLHPLIAAPVEAAEEGKGPTNGLF